MPRYVITPDVALHLARHGSTVAEENPLLAPTLLRSQTLSRLYRAVCGDEVGGGEADRQLHYVRSLRLRLLGDRVLQQVAWKIAAQLDWPDTLDAEYVALTRLQADALISLDAEFVRVVQSVVATAPVEALVRSR
jgi:predicted nucleic acid-binding protein